MLYGIQVRLKLIERMNRFLLYLMRKIVLQCLEIATTGSELMSYRA